MVLARIPFQTQARAGTVTLMAAVATTAGVPLQIYRARPRSINPPTAFIDSINEEMTEFTITMRQRRPTVEAVFLWGLFDSGEAADQRDAFVDAFVDYVADTYHAFGTNTLVASVRIQDIPAFIPDWVPDGEKKTYYGTQISLEGFAAT